MSFPPKIPLFSHMIPQTNLFPTWFIPLHIWFLTWFYLNVWAFPKLFPPMFMFTWFLTRIISPWSDSSIAIHDPHDVFIFTCDSWHKCKNLPPRDSFSFTYDFSHYLFSYDLFLKTWFHFNMWVSTRFFYVHLWFLTQIFFPPHNSFVCTSDFSNDSIWTCELLPRFFYAMIDSFSCLILFMIH